MEFNMSNVMGSFCVWVVHRERGRYPVEFVSAARCLSGGCRNRELCGVRELPQGRLGRIGA